MSEHDCTVDRLNVMLHLEANMYACPDYFAPEYRQSNPATKSSNSLLHVVEECAKLVTDLSITERNGRDRNETSSPHDVRERLDKPLSSSPGTVVLRRLPSCEAHLIPWRSQMCSWAYTLIDTFGYDRAIVAVAFNILDRYLAKECLSDVKITRQDFQLFSMTAVFLAVKLYESFDKLSIIAMMDCSRNFFSMKDFQETELDILEALDWRVTPPTANCFLVELWKIFPSEASFDWQSRSNDILEMAVADSFFVPLKASHLALAAMLVAGRQCRVPKKEMDKFCEDIKDIVNVEDPEFRLVLEHLRGY